jgi:hypothetical protein
MCRALVANPALDPKGDVLGKCKTLLTKFNSEWDTFLNGDQGTKDKMLCEALARGGNLSILSASDQARCRSLIAE